MSARCSEFAEVQDVAKTPFSSQNRVGNTSGNTSENTPGSTSETYQEAHQEAH